MNVEMNSLTHPESFATISNSMRSQMAIQEVNIEMRSLTPPESIATIPNSVRPKMANKEMIVKKGNEC